MMTDEQANSLLPDDLPGPPHVATDVRDDIRDDDDFLPYAVTFATFESAPRDAGLVPLLADLLTADIARARALKPKVET